MVEIKPSKMQTSIAQSPLTAGSFVFSKFGKIGQPYPSTPVSMMFFSDFENFEKAQMRGRIREMAC